MRFGKRVISVWLVAAPLGALGAARVSDMNDTGERINCDARVHPERDTYLTAKYAPGRGARHRYFILGPDGKRIPDTELDEGGLARRTEDGDFYETTRIPPALTKGKQSIRLTLEADGPDHRRILALWTHTNARFVPDGGSSVRAPAPDLPRFKPISRALADLCEKKLVDLHDGLVDWLMKRQFMDERYPDLIGAFDVSVQKGADGELDLEKTKNRLPGHYNALNNMGPLLLGAVVANGYTLKGSRHYRDREILRRVALYLDFCRRFQSASGTFWSTWESWRWLGGPKRGWASGSSLDGEGLRGIGHAFVAVAKALEQEGFLDELVDDDCDGATPKVPRRKAYEDLFAGLVQYLMRSGGASPNQEFCQLDALRYAWKACEILGGELPSGEELEKLDARLRKATGAVENGDTAWVSPKGMPLEHGGYSVEYGRGQDRMYYRAWRAWKKPYLRERAKIGGNAFIPFVRPVEGPLYFRACGYINFRHRNFLDGDVYHPTDIQVLDFKNPAHIRLWQLENIDLSEESVKSWRAPGPGNWFWMMAYEFSDSLRNRIRMCRELADPKSPVCADVHLPMERGQPDFVAGDEVAQTVAFKDGEERVFLCFNFRNHKETPDAEGRALIEVRGSRGDQFLRIPHHVQAEADGKPLSFGVGSLVLGDWFIVQNCDFKSTVRVALPKNWLGRDFCAVDLATGRQLPRTVSIAPQSTLVVKRRVPSERKG